MYDPMVNTKHTKQFRSAKWFWLISFVYKILHRHHHYKQSKSKINKTVCLSLFSVDIHKICKRKQKCGAKSSTSSTCCTYTKQRLKSNGFCNGNNNLIGIIQRRDLKIYHYYCILDLDIAHFDASLNKYIYTYCGVSHKNTALQRT